MNYRHIYHAGNACDVVKHAILALLIEHMKRKDKPFAVLDTHAGCGRYDLEAPRARQTGEAEAGAQRLVKAAPDVPELAPYRAVLAALNPSRTLRYYPGSPLLTRELLRPQDRLVACELHPEDSSQLRWLFRGDERAQIHERDGYESLKAFLPFPEKRGLVLIDPPFEQPNEWDRLVAAARTIHERMPGVTAALWYPIKERPAVWRFHEALIAAGLPKLLAVEFMFFPELRSDHLNGSGMVLLNPPWKLDEEVARLFAVLHDSLQTESQESFIKPLTAL